MTEERTCGDCRNYLFYTVTGPAEGWCTLFPGPRKGDPGKVVQFDTDASKCNKFDRLPEEEMVTDGYQFEYHPNLRIDAGHEMKRADVKVEGKFDEKCWG